MDTPALNLFTIPASENFVDVLARHLLAMAGDDPLALPRMQVLLPTRRAIRALREAFLRASGGKPLLLPIMQPIGEVDEEALAFAGWAESAMAPDGDDILPAISGTTRQMLLAKAVLEYQAQRFGTDQALLLARDLAALLDEAAREGIPLSRLHEIVPLELATHWQITLQFLQIITEHWPHMLDAQGVMDPTARRNALLRRLATHWETHPPQGPVIAAGTTGSAPATADLLAVIARLPQGMVVLPGLDQLSPDTVWDAIGEDASHPQYGLNRLLARLEASRDQVRLLTKAAPNPREALLHHALWPATVSDGWQKEKLPLASLLGALAGLHRVECASQQQEATVIALILREALEEKGKTAALITPNRILARRVAATLQRFHVAIDDSAGIPLADTPAGIFLRLLAEVAASDAAPVPLLALLKHPLARFGVAPEECRKLARLLERSILRGVRLKAGFAAMVVALKQPGLKIGELDRARLVAFVEQLAGMLAPLMAQDRAEVGAWLAAHASVAETASGGMIWHGEVGEQFAALFADWQENAVLLGTETLHAYPSLLVALMAGKTYRPAHGRHPRLAILSPMEARLQRFDRVVLAGLNEAEWPEPAHQDPWMSRQMREAMAFSRPERSVGLSAHDFLMQAAGGEVFLTRSVKSGGAETVPSRWLMRLDAVLGIADAKLLSDWKVASAHWLAWAEEVDASASAAVPCAAPEPKPAVALRPTKLPVTAIETLLRNPYGIYAKYILGLRKLDPIDQEPDASDFGDQVHAMIERFLKESPTEEQALERLRAIGAEVFAPLFDRPAIRAFWQPRLNRIAERFLEQHRAHVAEGAVVESETKSERDFALPSGAFTLTARIDRRETLPDGSRRLMDYKTGTLPKLADVWRGIACQLLLEALMEDAPVSSLEYWPLSGKAGEEEPVILEEAFAKSKLSKEMDFNDFLDSIEQKFKDLMTAYARADVPYCYAPSEGDKPKYDDYEHLARVKEWRG